MSRVYDRMDGTTAHAIATLHEQNAARRLLRQAARESALARIRESRAKQKELEKTLERLDAQIQTVSDPGNKIDVVRQNICVAAVRPDSPPSTTAMNSLLVRGGGASDALRPEKQQDRAVRYFAWAVVVSAAAVSTIPPAPSSSCATPS